MIVRFFFSEIINLKPFLSLLFSVYGLKVLLEGNVSHFFHSGLSFHFMSQNT